TGTGDYFTAGNDLANFLKKPEDRTEFTPPKELQGNHPEELLINPFYVFIATLIDFPKPLIAVVNGPAVGMGVTMLGLCDIVYASDRASFHTPFMSLALCPEGCSSLTFPQIMGPQRANEMLLFSKKITAKDAHEVGLVTQMFPHNQLEQVWPLLDKMAALPPGALVTAKALVRDPIREQLHKVNRTENILLVERILSDEARQIIKKMVKGSRKSRL
ncbi:unnamed protein product, partial [Meganyctiphanes norvegica]